MNLQQRVWLYSRRRGLLSPGDTIVVGVSGGPDSLCLLDILARLALRHHLTLHVAHLNHALRPEAIAEADFVREQSEKRGLQFHLRTLDAAQWSEHPQSVEETARNARYDFLSHVAGNVDAQSVAVAHTQDDQAETVLMHFLRGSGMAGLAGMEPKRHLGSQRLLNQAGEDQRPQIYLIRPLLDMTRADVLAHCAEAGLEPRFDTSNLDAAYFRNRLRNDLLPVLETYNPNIQAVLARTAEVMRGEFEWQSQAIDELWQATAHPDGDNASVTFVRDHWLLLSDAQRRALLRKAAGHLLGGLRNVDYGPIQAAARFSRTAAPGRSAQVMAGLSLVISADRVCLLVDSKRLEHASADLPHVEPGGGLSSGWRLQTNAVQAAEWPKDHVAANGSRWTVFVDGDRLGPNVMVRARRLGDRFAPLGMGGHHMKLSDFMVNEKVPPAVRDQWPLVVSGDDVVWVAGMRLDDRFRVRSDTMRVVRLEFIGPVRREDK